MNRFYILKYKRVAEGISDFWKVEMGISADIINDGSESVGTNAIKKFNGSFS